MRVDSSRSTSGVKGKKSVKKSGGAGASAFASHLGGAEEVENAAPAAGPAPVYGVNPLFAIQSVDSATEGNRRGQQMGFDMLGHLEEIQMGLLTGSVPVSRLRQLLELSRRLQEQQLDPKLASILNDIDLRVQIEIAKLRKVDPALAREFEKLP
jgi:hypothetical protein